MIIISHIYHTSLELKLLTSYLMTNLFQSQNKKKKICNSIEHIIFITTYYTNQY
jgi:hypothetical protein